MSSTAALFLVAVPDNSQKNEFDKISKCARGASKCQVHTFAADGLRVGTLDSLMSLSDELSKVDMMGEAVAKKIRRTFEELRIKCDVDKELTVGGLDPKQYIEQFAWKHDRFPRQRKLPELVKYIQNKMDHVDTNMKKLYSEYADSKAKLASLSRKSAGNALVADLNDMLTQEVLGQRNIADVFSESEYIKTVAVVVATKMKEEWESTYHLLDAEAVTLKQAGGAGGPAPAGKVNQGSTSTQFTVVTPSERSLPVEVKHEPGQQPSVLDLKYAVQETYDIKVEHQQIEWDEDLATDPTPLGTALIPGGSTLKLSLEMPQEVVQTVDRFSPVVPGSSQWLVDDNDGYSVYSVKILKGEGNAFLDGFKKACSEKRFTVRLWEPPVETKQGFETLKDQLNRTQASNDKLTKSLLRYTEPWFQDMFVSWIHIKVIRVFVDAVLNYGVPPNFVTALVDCKGGKETKKVLDALDKQYKSLDAVGVGELSKSGSDNAAVQALGGSAEYHPYVYLPINLGV